MVGFASVEFRLVTALRLLADAANIGAELCGLWGAACVGAGADRDGAGVADEFLRHTAQARPEMWGLSASALEGATQHSTDNCPEPSGLPYKTWRHAPAIPKDTLGEVARRMTAGADGTQAMGAKVTRCIPTTPRCKKRSQRCASRIRPLRHPLLRTALGAMWRNAHTGGPDFASLSRDKWIENDVGDRRRPCRGECEDAPRTSPKAFRVERRRAHLLRVLKHRWIHLAIKHKRFAGHGDAPRRAPALTFARPWSSAALVLCCGAPKTQSGELKFLRRRSPGESKPKPPQRPPPCVWRAAHGRSHRAAGRRTDLGTGESGGPARGATHTHKGYVHLCIIAYAEMGIQGERGRETTSRADALHACFPPM